MSMNFFIFTFLKIFLLDDTFLTPPKKSKIVNVYDILGLIILHFYNTSQK